MNALLKIVGAVALAAGMTASGLSFETTGYTVGSSTITLNGAAEISVAADVSVTVASLGVPG